MSDTLIEYATDRVRNLENRYTTWAHHPSYDSKKSIREEATRVLGVLEALTDANDPYGDRPLTAEAAALLRRRDAVVGHLDGLWNTHQARRDAWRRYQTSEERQNA